MKLHNIITWACAVMLTCMFVGCSDDEEALLRPAVDIESNSTTVSSLTFWWPDRDDAVSWHYVFTNEAGEVLSESDLPRDHCRRLVFAGLQPDSKYTLSVTAIAADGTTSTSVYTAKTNAVIALSTPTVTYTQEGYTVTMTWSAVSNAASYDYQLLDADGNVVEEGNTTETTLVNEDLEIGKYTLKVKANSTQEAYSDSEYGVLEIDRELGRMITSPGVYTTANGTVYHPALVYLEDGSYVIENFRGVAGYDLKFTVSSKKVNITNGKASGPTVQVEVGDGTTVSYMQNTSQFTGDAYEGSITFELGDGTEETYTWETLVLPSFEVTLYGCIYMSGYSDEYSDEFEIPAEARNGVITIDDFLGSGKTVTLTYDKEAETATIDLATGFTTGWFYIGDFPRLKYIYYYGSAYCTYDAEYDAISVQFYSYTEDGGIYWSYFYIYVDNID